MKSTDSNYVEPLNPEPPQSPRRIAAANSQFSRSGDRMQNDHSRKRSRAYELDERRRVEATYGPLLGFAVKLRRSKDGWRLLPVLEALRSMGSKQALSFLAARLRNKPGHATPNEAANAALKEYTAFIKAPIDPNGKYQSPDVDYKSYPERLTLHGHARLRMQLNAADDHLDTILDGMELASFSLEDSSALEEMQILKERFCDLGTDLLDRSINHEHPDKHISDCVDPQPQPTLEPLDRELHRPHQKGI